MMQILSAVAALYRIIIQVLLHHFNQYESQLPVGIKS